MRHVTITAALLFLLLGAAPLLAFEAVGTILKVDADNSVLYIHANGQERTVVVARDAKFLGADGKPLAGGLKAKELKEGTVVTVTVERVDNKSVIHALRIGKVVATEPKEGGKATFGLKPLVEMSATDKYKGEDGGLYGGGKNEPPEGHLKAARAESAKIEPRDVDGKPAKDGKICLLSISMSNATQEFSLFKQIADKDPKKSSRLTIVDGAQGGQAMAQWVDPKARPWAEADRRLEAAGVSPKQVQVVWVKLANVRPTGELAEHVKKLQSDTQAVLQNAKARYPNLRVAYLGSRIYGGWANTALNPEPYAYEGAFAVRGLIRDQIKGDVELSFDAGKVPLLLWGPYLWADGTTPRKSDGLVWERKDLAGDGTHPSQSGRQKVADLLLKFFQTDALASRWYLKE